MKIFSRNFSNKEKVLILILVVVLVGLFYYKFVDSNVRDTVTSANAEAEALESELSMAEINLMQLQKMQSELDSLEEKGDSSIMKSYNASKEEIAFLNDILADTVQYSVSFGDVTRNGDQIRRNFTLQYQTRTYAAAEDIMRQLCDGPYRCLVGDVRCSINEDGIVTINEAATFYETMVGGKADSGLPADAAATVEQTE